MNVPAVVVGLVLGRPEVGEPEQAFPFVTVGEGGHPHIALLSRAELEVAGDAALLVAAIRGRRTRAHLSREGRATLLVVEGTSAHSLHLMVQTTRTSGDLLAAAFEVVHHEEDSLGIPLDPVRFIPTHHLARSERWDDAERLLHELSGQHEMGA